MSYDERMVLEYYRNDNLDGVIMQLGVCTCIQFHKTKGSLRKGQILFNVAYDFFPEEVDKIRGTDIDCFYKDEKQEEFLKELKKLLRKE